MILWILSLFAAAATAATYECPNVASTVSTMTATTHLRLVQYNAEWLFIDYYSPMNCPGDGCTWKNMTAAETHMDRVVERLAALDADIINLCEVESCDELSMLSTALATTTPTYTPYLKQGTDTSTGQNVGMLTRIAPATNLYRTEARAEYPIPGSKCGYTGPSGTTGVSKHYITEFILGDLHVAFISAHLLAIPTDVDRCAQREAQAIVLQSVVADYINVRGYEVILLGDFNDYDGEVPDMNSNKPTSMVLDILKGVVAGAGTFRLYNVAEDNIAQEERYTDWWDSDSNCTTSSREDYSMIDHILVTDAMRKKVVGAFIYHEYAEYCGKYDSDHYPVVVDFAL